MSITTLLLKGARGEVITAVESVEELALFKVYPNPVSSPSEVNVEIRGPGRARLRLLDANAKTIATILDQRVGEGVYKTSVNLAALAKGLYVVQLCLDGKLYHRKISVM